ncbi:cytochrome c oxidase subunit II [Spirulina sp. CCNP1310]|uniref:cytochrome c oxidase subunit II n=1 Tax=Spirulina sp. CCNP1310 TaxID=3110249 RepID=UPI002B21B399|nr:cytochrome c oxidase subunit II [Spirulina sp. CCNP1310]MEA5418874.1 cytochrome c oxidase subunit II [Spirulina sp. CCNP1310]
MANEKETVPGTLITLVIGVAVTGISIWYGQNNNLLPEQVSLQAPLVDDLFNIMVVIGTALFLVVEGAIVFTLIKFRHRPGDETDSQPVMGNFSLEIFWTAIPAFIVIGLGIYSVQVYNQMGGFDAGGHMAHHGHAPVQVASLPGSDGPLLAQSGDVTYGLGANAEMGVRPADLNVDVAAMQYAWIFTYPETGIISGELHVPLGQDVKLNLEAKDVLHAFWLPQFRIKQDVIPGQQTQLRFVATKTGTYPIVCAELCGSYHGGMRSQIIVHSPEDYQAWVESNTVAQAPGLEQTVAMNTDSHHYDDVDRLAAFTRQFDMDHVGPAIAAHTHL